MLCLFIDMNLAIYLTELIVSSKFSSSIADYAFSGDIYFNLGLIWNTL